MIDYTKFKNDGDLLHTLGDDAQKWAAAFKQRNSESNVEEDVLISWFASAIEHSNDIRNRRMRERLHALETVNDELTTVIAESIAGSPTP